MVILITASRVQSLDRRMMRRDPVIIDFDQEPPCKAPIYANRYAMDDNDERRGEGRRQNYRSQSMPRQSRFGDRLNPPGRGGPSDNRSLYNESNLEMQPSSKGRKRERPGKLFVSLLSCLDQLITIFKNREALKYL